MKTQTVKIEELTAFAARVYSKMGATDHEQFWKLVRMLENASKA
jgi:hypothetical protein